MVNWTDIHPDFAKEWNYDTTYQQLWEEDDLTYQDAQAWIPAGFKPEDYQTVKQWKNSSFTPAQVQSLVKQGYQLDDYYLLPTYAHSKRLQLTDLQQPAIQIDYLNWRKNLTLQEFLNSKYPSSLEKEPVKEIWIDYSSDTIPQEQSQLLQGNKLNLSAYPNLEWVIIRGNDLKSPPNWIEFTWL